jgi:hypothetical protein
MFHYVIRSRKLNYVCGNMCRYFYLCSVCIFREFQFYKLTVIKMSTLCGNVLYKSSGNIKMDFYVTFNSFTLVIRMCTIKYMESKLDLWHIISSSVQIKLFHSWVNYVKSPISEFSIKMHRSYTVKCISVAYFENLSLLEQNLNQYSLCIWHNNLTVLIFVCLQRKMCMTDMKQNLVRSGVL